MSQVRQQLNDGGKPKKWLGFLGQRTKSSFSVSGREIDEGRSR